MTYKSRQYTLWFGGMYFVIAAIVFGGGIALSFQSDTFITAMILIVIAVIEFVFGLVKSQHISLYH